MKSFLIYIIICLLFSGSACQIKKEPGESVTGKKGQNSPIQSDKSPATEDDSSVLPPLDTLITVKEIREIISRFQHQPAQEISDQAQRLQENIVGIWDADDTVYIDLIVVNNEFIRAFKKYVIYSPRIVFYDPPTSPPSQMIQSDTSQFFMQVRPNIYSPTIEQIEIHITNHSQKEIIAGEDYYLEYYDGTAWVSVPQNYNFEALGYIIKPGKTDDFTAFLYPRLSPKRIGQYRVWKTVNVKEKEKYEGYALVATFFISDRLEE